MMKKNGKICIVLTFLACTMLFTACAINQKSEMGGNESSFNMKLASNVVETYMNYLIKNDFEGMKSLYSKELLKSPVKEENNKLKVLGYNVFDRSKVGNSAIFMVNVPRAYLDRPFTSLDRYTLKITKEKNEYKIVDIKNVVQQEAFVYKNKIRMKNKDSADTNMIVELKSLPNYVFSKEDKTKLDKIPVPKYNPYIINFSYEGSMLAITTYNVNSYIGIVKIDQTMATQGQMAQNGGSSDSQEGSSGDNGGSQNIVEKPIGKQLITLDLLKNSKVNLMEFSKDEKLLMVQYSSKNVENCIRVYKVDDGEMIDFKFEKKFPLDKVKILFSSFGQDTLNFDVVPKNKNTEDESTARITGKWRMDLKDFKAERM